LEKFDFPTANGNSVAQLKILKLKPHTIEPGPYRVYLAPAALYEILQLLCWNSFGLSSQRTKESALLKMLEEPALQLHSSVTLTENTADGIAPAFQSKGFIKPSQVPLIVQGVYQSALISPVLLKNTKSTPMGLMTTKPRFLLT
jgi:predicted Zn-dependent protease